MKKIRDVLEALESVAPSRYAFSFDKIGLQVGSLDQTVTRAVVSLDRSLGAVHFAHCQGAELLLAHHPLIFEPMRTVDDRSHQGRTVVELIKNGTSFLAAHTNWDSALGGVNDTLAKLLGLSKIESFGSAADVSHLKLGITCPAEFVERIIDAASDAGAGVVGAYRRCAFYSEGTGSFIGDPGTRPVVGKPGIRETSPEARVEMVVPTDRADAVRKSIDKIHPYETPSIDFYQLRPDREQPTGRVGTLTTRITLSKLGALVESALGTRSLIWGDPKRSIGKVAVVGGAADGEWIAAQRSGADVLITGEVKQHVALEASESGMALIAAGHYHTEHPGCEALRLRMESAIPEIEWLLFTPPPGLHGRPSFAL